MITVLNDFHSSHDTFISTSSKKDYTITEEENKINKFIYLFIIINFIFINSTLLFLSGNRGMFHD